MQKRKSFIALALALALVASISASVFSVFASYSMVERTEKAYKIENAEYTEYDITSGVNGHTTKANMLEFSTEDYIPMVFTCFAGSASKLENQYNYAVNKYGYDVIAAMNGSFFSMADGTLVGINISNGKISCAHAGYSGEVVAFSSDGHFDVVSSNISYSLSLGGKDVPNGIYYINKTSGKSGTWSNRFYYFDTSCGSTCDTYDTCKGYELVCKKINNTDLVVGGTLQGEILEIKENSYSTKLTQDTMSLSDKFVLFVKSDSSYASYVKDLSVGDKVEISASETVAASREIMENASSVITNVGWLVKDGVDQTKIYSTIGTHSVTLCARWNAFGVKADGSYVFFTSEGGSTGDTDLSVTLQDVAKAMMDAGCVNVIRMDGGGSVGLYVKDDGSGNPGYLTPSSRAISDCILIVKRPQATEEQKQTLDDLMNEAEEVVSSAEDASVQAAYDAAKKVIESKTSTDGDYKRAIILLSKVFSGSAELTDAINLAKGIFTKNYSASQAEAIWAAYDYALAVKNTENATPAAIKEASENLKNAIQCDVNLALNCSYTLKGVYPNISSATYPDEGGKTITDGNIASAASYADSAWVGFNINADDIKDGNKISSIVVNLSKTSSVGKIVVNALENAAAGIKLPKKTEFFASDDGTTWNSIGEGVFETTSTGDRIENIILSLETPVNAKYIKAEFTANSNWTFISEIQVMQGIEKLDNIGWVKGFNSKIAAGDAYIFTPDETPELTGSAANVNWSQAVYLKWDEAKQGYKVTEVKYPDGVAGKTLDSDMICIGVHNSQVEGDTDGSAANRLYAATAKIGDYVEFYGIYTDIKEAYPSGYFKFVSADKFNKAYNGKYTAKEYDIPTTEQKVMTGEITLVPEQSYDNTEGGGSSATYKFENGKFIVEDTGTGWPCVFTDYAKPVYVDFDNAYIDIDFTVEGGYTSILVMVNDGQYIKIQQNVEGTLDTGSGDLGAGTYKLKCKLSEISAYDQENEAAKNYAGKVELKPDSDGNITFTGVTVFATGGATVTINKLAILADYEEEPEEPDESEEEPSAEPQESEPEEESDTPTPVTGDSGIIALAVVSVVAAAAVMVVKKSK